MEYPTQQLPPQQPAPQPPARRGRGWVVPAVLGALLLAGGLTAAALAAGPSPGSTGGIGVSDAADLDALLATDTGSADAGAQPRDRPLLRGHRGRGPWHLQNGEKVVAGSVGSVDAANPGKLVVHKDNGADVTIATNGDTKVRGAQNKALSDLQSGERVIVKVGSDGVADGVLAVKAHAAGTVTKLDGDRATVVRPGGLSVVLDLSGVSERPAVGTVVVAVGTATDDGATLKVEQIRELPTLG